MDGRKLKRQADEDEKMCSDWVDEALQKAIRRNCADVVQVLLEEGGASADVPDRCCMSAEGRTMLMWAALTNSEKMVRLLVVKGRANVNLSDENGKTVLMFASENGYPNIVRLLLVEGRANPHCETRDGWTALMFATRNGRLECVRLLVEVGGANVNHMSVMMCTSLKNAIGRSHVGVVRYLLNRSDIKDTWDAFRSAVECGVEKVVAVFLEYGFGPASSPKSSALLRAALYSEAVDVVALLLEEVLWDVNETNSKGKTALMIAAEAGNVDIVRVLLINGHADVDTQDKEGNTAASLATSAEVQKLLSISAY